MRRRLAQRVAALESIDASMRRIRTGEAHRQLAEVIDQRVAALEARQLPEVERLQVAEVRPGDTIIATTQSGVGEDGLDRLKAGIEAIFPEQEVIVTVGVTLDVQREKQ